MADDVEAAVAARRPWWGRVNLEKWAYGTVTLLGVLVLVEWAAGESLVTAYVAEVSIALAIAAAHFYAALVQAYAEHGGRLPWQVVKECATEQVTFIQLTVPLLFVFGVSQLFGLSAQASVDLGEWVLVGSLAVAAISVAHHNGIRGPRAWLAGSGALVAAVLVVLAQVFLKPH